MFHTIHVGQTTGPTPIDTIGETRTSRVLRITEVALAIIFLAVGAHIVATGNLWGTGLIVSSPLLLALAFSVKWGVKPPQRGVPEAQAALTLESIPETDVFLGVLDEAAGAAEAQPWHTPGEPFHVPDEMAQLGIFSWLEPEDYLNAALVSSEWMRIAKDENFDRFKELFTDLAGFETALAVHLANRNSMSQLGIIPYPDAVTEIERVFVDGDQLVLTTSGAEPSMRVLDLGAKRWRPVEERPGEIVAISQERAYFKVENTIFDGDGFEIEARHLVINDEFQVIVTPNAVSCNDGIILPYAGDPPRIALQGALLVAAAPNQTTLYDLRQNQEVISFDTPPGSSTTLAPLVGYSHIAIPHANNRYFYRLSLDGELVSPGITLAHPLDVDKPLICIEGDVLVAVMPKDKKSCVLEMWDLGTGARIQHLDLTALVPRKKLLNMSYFGGRIFLFTPERVLVLAS